MKVLAYCWNCNKEYDITRWSMKYGVKCDSGCGGYVISPSGKVQSRIIGEITSVPEQLLKLV